jgi:hypothetical protein
VVDRRFGAEILRRCAYGGAIRMTIRVARVIVVVIGHDKRRQHEDEHGALRCTRAEILRRCAYGGSSG